MHMWCLHLLFQPFSLCVCRWPPACEYHWSRFRNTRCRCIPDMLSRLSTRVWLLLVLQRNVGDSTHRFCFRFHCRKKDRGDLHMYGNKPRDQNLYVQDQILQSQWWVSLLSLFGMWLLLCHYDRAHKHNSVLWRDHVKMYWHFLERKNTIILELSCNYNLHLSSSLFLSHNVHPSLPLSFCLPPPIPRKSDGDGCVCFVRPCDVQMSLQSCRTSQRKRPLAPSAVIYCKKKKSYC